MENNILELRDKKYFQYKKKDIKLKIEELKLIEEIKNITNDKLNNEIINKSSSEKRREVPGPQIKIIKDKNGFFEDKSGKYINLKEYNNIIRNIIIIIICLIKLSNNNIIEYSNITLKINGIGNKNILSSEFNSINYPNIIYINEIKQPTITYQYNLNETDNFVKLIWNNTINNCYAMFYECRILLKLIYLILILH